MSNPSRRSIMLSGAAASLAAGSLAAEADQAVTSPLPQPVFDASAFLAKLDEIGQGDAHDLLDAISVPLQERYGVAVITAWRIEVAADIFESADDDAPGDGLNTPGYREKAAKQLRDALAGVKQPDRWNYDASLPDDTLAIMEESEQRAAAMTAEERNAPLKKKPKGRENVDPDLG
jgi:hypothetical protein